MNSSGLPEPKNRPARTLSRPSTFDTPLTEDERDELRRMPSHELYLLTKMVPPASVRGQEVHVLYRECLARAVRRG